MRSSTGHTFGGYAAGPWHSQGRFENYPGSFIFLVENPHGNAPTFFECRDSAYAVECGPPYYPWFGEFGGGSGDFALFNGAQGCSLRFPSSYIDTLGHGNATFTGAADGKFTLEDFEVWAAS